MICSRAKYRLLLPWKFLVLIHRWCVWFFPSSHVELERKNVQPLEIYCMANTSCDTDLLPPAQTILPGSVTCDPWEDWLSWGFSPHCKERPKIEQPILTLIGTGISTNMYRRVRGLCSRQSKYSERFAMNWNLGKPWLNERRNMASRKALVWRWFSRINVWF